MEVAGYNVQTAMVVYRTYSLMKDAIASVRRFYPEMDFIVVDNTDGTVPADLRPWARENRVKLIRVGSNIGHGPGMNVALWSTDADVLLILDTDTEMRKPGLLEDALSQARTRPERWYGIGKIGVPKVLIGGESIAYLHPAVCLVNVEQYRKFEPFTDHGAPTVAAMYDLHIKGLTKRLIGFPVLDYVKHFWAKTRNACKRGGLDRSYSDRMSKEWWEPGKF